MHLSYHRHFAVAGILGEAARKVLSHKSPKGIALAGGFTAFGFIGSFPAYVVISRITFENLSFSYGNTGEDRKYIQAMNFVR